MKTKDFFSLAVRIMGLIFLYRGIDLAPALIDGFARSFGSGEAAGIWEAIKAAWPIFVGLYLVRGAPLLLQWAFPTEKASDDHTVVHELRAEPQS